MIEFPNIAGPEFSNLTEDDNHAKEVFRDFWIACISREASIIARKDVLTGKAKFGIVGDGKEVAQIAMAKAFQRGDFRSGYYRDQTFMFAMGLSTIEDYFAQLFADPINDPFSAGRQMNAHFATPMVNTEGEWLTHKEMFNVSADLSCTAGQMARALGLAMASKKYRELDQLPDNQFSEGGNEVSFVTIGDASTSEGIFWETMNAAAVEQVPLAVAVWDDGYGISVPIALQTTKQSISKSLEGLLIEEGSNGIRIYTASGWDYPSLCEMFETGVAKIRKSHVPALFHVREVTQPQGHSTSGSHERYKSKERLNWEKEYDCIVKMAQWMIDVKIADQQQIDKIKEEAKAYAKTCRDNAWAAFRKPIDEEYIVLGEIFDACPADIANVQKLQAEYKSLLVPALSECLKMARRMMFVSEQNHRKNLPLQGWINRINKLGDQRYHSNLHSETPNAAINIAPIQAVINADCVQSTGYQVLNACFDKALERIPTLFAFGEDVGQIGDVNQGFAGLQNKYGRHRVYDAGIREWSIVGQAIGMSMRGLRTIAEIQYLDYLPYAISPLMDDLATLRYRSNGMQMAPAIIRTRGHRLEGIWHAGSPIGMIINSCRGIYLCVPRNMTQAAGMYNTLLQGDDPAIVIECLNGYRLREAMPDNIAEFRVPLGEVELLKSGSDLTLVTYGSCVRVAEEAIAMLAELDIAVELIDVQTLLPFDMDQMIVESIKKTNRLMVLDEDVPGGASAYMLQCILEGQQAYQYLDSAPVTISAHAHRTPFGSDGDYFTKPQVEDIYESVVIMIREADPQKFMQ